MTPLQFAWWAEVAMRRPGRHGWQTQLSETLDVADRTIRRWITGESPVPDGVALAVRQGVEIWVGDVPALCAQALDFEGDRAGRAADDLLRIAKRTDVQDSGLLCETLHVVGAGGSIVLSWQSEADYRETPLGRRLYRLADVAGRWQSDDFSAGMIAPMREPLRFGPEWFQAVVWPTAAR